MYSSELHLHKLGLDQESNTARDVFIATSLEPTVPELYRAYVLVFSEADLESMPSHYHQDPAIKLLNSK
jgi:hypothetical protein